MFDYRTPLIPPRIPRRNLPTKLVVAVFVAFCLGGGLSMAQEEFALDWSVIGAGQAISGTPYGPKGVPLLLQSKTAVIADTSSSPPNPFTNSELSLFVDQGPDSQLSRLRLRAFQNETPASGSFEINFRLVEGRLRLDTGATNVPWDPLNDWAYILTDVFFGIRFTVDEPIQCRSATGLRTESIGAISPEENYTFRGEWETDGDNIVFQFYLNGEPLITREKQPFFQPVPKTSLGNQSLSLAINIGSSEEPRSRVFVGRISATAGGP